MKKLKIANFIVNHTRLQTDAFKSFGGVFSYLSTTVESVYKTIRVILHRNASKILVLKFAPNIAPHNSKRGIVVGFSGAVRALAHNNLITTLFAFLLSERK